MIIINIFVVALFKTFVLLNYISINMSEYNFAYFWSNVLFSLLKLSPFQKELTNFKLVVPCIVIQCE